MELGAMIGLERPHRHRGEGVADGGQLPTWGGPDGSVDAAYDEEWFWARFDAVYRDPDTPVVQPVEL